MEESPFNIVHAVTVKRTPKKILIPDSVFSSEYPAIHKQRKEHRPPNLSPWRFVSSGVVSRGAQQTPENPSTEVKESSKYFPNETLPTVQLPKNYNWTEGLRVPSKNKPKSVVDPDSSMTRNCEQLFHRMSTFKVEKPAVHVDPSQSVRRIIKGSGLLKSFGTGLIRDEPDESLIISQPETEPSQQEVPPQLGKFYGFQETTEPNSFTETETSLLENPSSPPFSSYPSPPPSPKMYETVVMQKTVATELYYYPQGPSSDFEVFPSWSEANR